jgi:hypothetical protein
MHCRRKTICSKFIPINGDTNLYESIREFFHPEECDVMIKDHKQYTLVKFVDESKVYVCNECGLFTSSQYGIRKHLQKNHPQQEVNPTQTTENTNNSDIGQQTNNNNENTNGNQFNMSHINSVVINNYNAPRINPLGKEDISYLTQSPDFKKFMTQCIRQGVEGVCRFMVKTHFDKDHPENHNIRKTNKKDDFMEYHDGTEWHLGYPDDILENVFGSVMKDAFTEFVDEFISDIKVLQKALVTRFMKNVGEPLDWDFTSDQFDYEFNHLTEEHRQKLKDRVFKLAVEYIYRNTQTVKQPMSASEK